MSPRERAPLPANPPPKDGRPPEIDDNVRGKLIMALAAGLSNREAASWVGCSHATVNRFVKQEKHTGNLAHYSKLARLHPYLCIYRAAETSWKGAVCLVELLERRHGAFETDALFDALLETVNEVISSKYTSEDE